jgi:hypothetical protein
MNQDRDKHERLREIAYRIWEQEGRPSGLDRKHWEMAEFIQADEAEAEAKDRSSPPALQGEDEA